MPSPWCHYRLAVSKYYSHFGGKHRKRLWNLFQAFQFKNFSKTVQNLFQFFLKNFGFWKTKDKASSPLTLGMVSHNGYFSCFTCLSPGEKRDKEATVYTYVMNEKFAMRTHDFYEYCCQILQKNGLERFGGQKGRSCLRQLPGFDDKFVPEPFHNIVGVVETFWADPSLFGLSEQTVSRNNRGVKLTYEIKVEQTNLGEGRPIRMVQWINFLLYISLPILFNNKASDAHLRHWFLFVRFAAVLNQKVKGVIVGKLYELQADIQMFVAWAEKLFKRSVNTPKLHSLLHIISFILRYGLLWNWGEFSNCKFSFSVERLQKGAKVFESFLHPMKKAAMNSKINAIVSVKNKMLNNASLLNFCGFTQEDYQTMGAAEQTAEFFSENLSFEEKVKKRRDGRTHITIEMADGRTVKVNSFNKKLHEPTGETININCYAEKLQTNDCFVVIDKQGSNRIVRVEAIDRVSDAVYYRPAVFNEESLEIREMTDDYCNFIISWAPVERSTWESVKEKLVCFKLTRGWFSLKIYR